MWSARPNGAARAGGTSPTVRSCGGPLPGASRRLPGCIVRVSGRLVSPGSSRPPGYCDHVAFGLHVVGEAAAVGAPGGVGERPRGEDGAVRRELEDAGLSLVDRPEVFSCYFVSFHVYVLLVILQ